ncbi:unnamed protein product, partial [Prorocentrum cordatum]
DYSQFYQMFARAAASLGSRMAPHQGRHSEVSIDRAQRTRSLDERVKRGRWGSAKSVAKFEGTGRLNDAWTELTPVSRSTSSTASATSRIASCVGADCPPRLYTHDLLPGRIVQWDKPSCGGGAAGWLRDPR